MEDDDYWKNSFFFFDIFDNDWQYCIIQCDIFVLLYKNEKMLDFEDDQRFLFLVEIISNVVHRCCL